MKKNSAKMKLLSAAGMLGISAAMLATSTYAWFTMNTQVEVKGLQVQATAEQGLIISDNNKGNWGSLQNVGMSASAILAPTSAYATNSPAFVHNTSDLFDNAKADQDANYESLTLDWSTETASTGSIGSVTTGTTPNQTTVDYVLKKTFYIKSSGAEWDEALVIDEVKAEVTGTSTSENLNKSLRVLVVATSGSNNNSFIYAPFTGATTSYNWKGTASGAQAVTAKNSTADSECANITSIPASNTESPIMIEMYIYFEGEDAQCKSSNLSGISADNIIISAKFKTTAGPAD